MVVSWKGFFGWYVKIGAIVTLAIGVYVIPHFVLPIFHDVKMSEFVIVGKSIAGAYCLDFREPGQTGQNDEPMHYYFNGHSGFYNAAREGDHMWVGGGDNIWSDAYRKLVRDGHVVAVYYSERQTLGAAYLLATLLPVLSFFRWKNAVLTYVIWTVAALAESAIVGVVTVWAFMIYAIVHSHGC